MNDEIRILKQEVINFLSEKKICDMKFFPSDKAGWTTVASIQKGLGIDKKACAITGILLRLSQEGFVETIKTIDMECKERRYYRISDDIVIEKNFSLRKKELC